MKLSVSIPIIPTVKAQVRSLTEKNSAKLAEKSIERNYSVRSQSIISCSVKSPKIKTKDEHI